MNNIVDFGVRLKEALNIRKMTPSELSEKTKISKSSISQYMSGYTNPSDGRIYTLAKALNVSEAWLIGYDVPMQGEKAVVPEIEPDHLELISLYAMCTDEQKKSIMTLLRSFVY